MILLAIETSCDETAVSIVKRIRGKTIRFEVLSHKVLSQIDLHKEYGGVFPALAKREHAKALTQLIAESLEEAGLLVERTNTYHIPSASRKKLETLLEREGEMLSAMKVLLEGIQKPLIDGIAVTEGPGLEPALWVGINAALALYLVWDIPIYPINHMEGHIVAGALSCVESIYEISPMTFPACALLISGGHTELVRIPKLRSYTVIGNTKDDAAGEAFDKVARMLSLPYPGGPEISRIAERARKEGLIVDEDLRLPRPMLHSGDLHFSFSGLKTAVLTRIKKRKELDDVTKRMLAVEFENAVTDVLVAKVKQAMYETRANTLIVGGGVSANTHIRFALKQLSESEGFDLYAPDKNLSTDNGIMIAATGLLHLAHDVAPKIKLCANGSWKLDDC
ncbi:MAG: tRNA (adenosine(37)-N6)-threonylcarbamoyltransferase complex transferase subunit TsaD [Candidatus Pacebacteria bacterium]|nr:tRNA (adenosine(37)-N6)-threonylcarbamoyltransferase complex transferase subunit TsaD [Candidatus Paceibacterota bacterium]MBP9866848.1 tRNA (adenosine(37)-N6)-threonylcarbamoyltransferase complex transferase subunit TsaD [Candidatus Paceibacterota bacterium]